MNSRHFKRVRLLFVLFAILGAASSCVFGQAVRFSKANSGLADDFINRLALFQGNPVVCTDGGVSLSSPAGFQTWKRGDRGFPDAPAVCGAEFGGKLWIGTYGKGIARLEGSTWTTITRTDSGLIDDYVTSLFVMGTRLYVGTRAGLCSFDGLLWERIPLDRNRSLIVTCLAQHGNSLLVGTNSGIFRLSEAAGPVPVELGIQPQPWISAMTAGQGVLFIGVDSGLLAVLADGRIINWGSDKLPSVKVFDIASDERGALCATGRGTVGVSLDGMSFLVDPAESLETAGVPATAVIRSGGSWWIGLAGGGLVRLPEGAVVFPAPGTAQTPSAVSGTSPLAEVRNFLPPNATPTPAPGGLSRQASTVAGQPASGLQPAPGTDPKERRPPAWTLSQKPPKLKDITYFKDILPMMVKDCMACHTSGSGKYFPLNDPKVIIPYFKKGGMDRFMQFLEPGNGMAGVVDPKNVKLLHVWGTEGFRE